MPTERTTRQQFLAGVRLACATGGGGSLLPVRQGSPEPDPADALVRLASSGDDLLTMFAACAKTVGMNVRHTKSASLQGAINDVLTAQGARRVAISIEDTALQTVVAAQGVEAAPWRTTPALDALYAADAGITDVLAGIAETGTLVVRSAASTTRGGFLVPPIHIALVPASRIVPDLIDAVRLLRPMPTSVVMITGPSKTADIEGILITGVHGPKEVHIIVIEDA